MLRPSVAQLLKNNESYYSLVIAVSKRARQIADDLVERKEILEEKPVKTAVDEFAAGEYRIIEDPSLTQSRKQ